MVSCRIRVTFTVSLLRVAEAGPDVLGVGAQLFLDAEQLVVLGHPLAPARGASLDLAGAEADHQVRDEAVLSLARPVRHHGAPAISLGQIVRSNGLCDGPNLVDFE